MWAFFTASCDCEGATDTVCTHNVLSYYLMRTTLFWLSSTWVLGSPIVQHVIGASCLSIAIIMPISAMQRSVVNEARG